MKPIIKQTLEASMIATLTVFVISKTSDTPDMKQQLTVFAGAFMLVYFVVSFVIHKAVRK